MVGLGVAGGDVVQHRIAEDMVEGVGLGNIATALADDDRELDFIIELLGMGRMALDAVCVADDGGRRLGEIFRELRVGRRNVLGAGHFLDVQLVVAADAEDVLGRARQGRGDNVVRQGRPQVGCAALLGRREGRAGVRQSLIAAGHEAAQRHRQILAGQGAGGADEIENALLRIERAKAQAAENFVGQEFHWDVPFWMVVKRINSGKRDRPKDAKSHAGLAGQGRESCAGHTCAAAASR